MKKSVILMAGLMAMALAGSAQAAPMFAVQDSNSVDKFTVDATGVVNAAGTPTIVGGAFAGQLAKSVKGLNGTGTGVTTPAGVFHVASEGNGSGDPAFLVQHVGLPTAPAGTTFFNATASNFSFYRNNKLDNGTYLLPAAGNQIGYFNFGTIDPAANPDSTASRVNAALFGVRAESAWTTAATPTFFVWTSTSTFNGAFVEKMRLTSTGNLGIGSAAPTSKLHVVGLLVSADETGLPVPAGLTSGAFYRTPAGVVRVAP